MLTRRAYSHPTEDEEQSSNFSDDQLSAQPPREHKKKLSSWIGSGGDTKKEELLCAKLSTWSGIGGHFEAAVAAVQVATIVAKSEPEQAAAAPTEEGPTKFGTAAENNPVEPSTTTTGPVSSSKEGGACAGVGVEDEKEKGIVDDVVSEEKKKTCSSVGQQEKETILWDLLNTFPPPPPPEKCVISSGSPRVSDFLLEKNLVNGSPKVSDYSLGDKCVERGNPKVSELLLLEKKGLSIICDSEKPSLSRSSSGSFCSRIPLPPSSCGSGTRDNFEEKLRRSAREEAKMAPIDPHSYTDAAHPLTKHVALTISLDFDSKTISGTVTLTLEKAHSGEIFLDTRDLTIDGAWDANKRGLKFVLEPANKIKGSLLRVVLENEVSVFTVSFKTSPQALALQWLDPAQTGGGKFPYMFTQCQAIHARSIFPCQDTPIARIKYSADVNIPAELSAVMSAAYVGRVPGDTEARVIERFVMEQPIPPYLFALAVGDITYEEVGPRTRIFAEPSEIRVAAYEFAHTENTVKQAEALFGPYDWERFDLLVMPPSFPYGGMENPRMVFLTPTIISGDRSGVEVVAHELAHSWTGNLISNATANDFWLNEGFTTYAERRIVEVQDGVDRVALHIGLGWQGLEEEVQRFKDQPEFTKLKQNLEGVDPDEVYSKVPYEKGFLFLRHLEQKVGRPTFDEFLKKYIAKFRFQSIDTETFIVFLKEQLPKVEELVDLDTWINGTGIPKDAVRPEAGILQTVLSLADGFKSGVRLQEANIEGWEAQEYIVYLERLPKKLSAEEIAELESGFQFSKSKNWEIKVATLTIAAYSAYEPLFPAIEQTLHVVGRMKYLKPLYQGLLESSREGNALAKKVFEQAKNKYHPIAQSVVQGLIAKYP